MLWVIFLANSLSNLEVWVLNLNLLIYQPTTNNQQSITMGLWFLILLKVGTEAIKISKIIGWKLTYHIILSFYGNHKRAWN